MRPVTEFVDVTVNVCGPLTVPTACAQYVKASPGRLGPGQEGGVGGSMTNVAPVPAMFTKPVPLSVRLACRGPSVVGENATSNEQLPFAAKLPVQLSLLIVKSPALKSAEYPGTAASPIETLLAAELKVIVNGTTGLMVPGI